jgi:hypothetical protein
MKGFAILLLALLWVLTIASCATVSDQYDLSRAARAAASSDSGSLGEHETQPSAAISGDEAPPTF